MWRKVVANVATFVVPMPVSNVAMLATAADKEVDKDVKSVCDAFLSTSSRRSDIWLAWATVPTAPNEPIPRLIKF